MITPAYFLEAVSSPQCRDSKPKQSQAVSLWGDRDQSPGRPMCLDMQGRVSDRRKLHRKNLSFSEGLLYSLVSDLFTCMRKLPEAGERTPESRRPNNSWSSFRAGKSSFSQTSIERLCHMQGIELRPQWYCHSTGAK